VICRIPSLIAFTKLSHLSRELRDKHGRTGSHLGILVLFVTTHAGNVRPAFCLGHPDAAGPVQSRLFPFAAGQALAPSVIASLLATPVRKTAEIDPAVDIGCSNSALPTCERSLPVYGPY
jgi:hypothetical protein